MDKEVHKLIVQEICNYIEIDEYSKSLLIQTCAKPDEDYEISIATTGLESQRKMQEKASYYDGLPRNGFWDGPKIWLQKWGTISTIQIECWVDQGLEYSHWAIEHGPNSIQNSIESYQKVSKVNNNEEMINELAYTTHYIVDTGTPYHRKDLKEISEVPETTPHDKYDEAIVKNFFKFAQSAVIGHKNFEEFLYKYWTTGYGYTQFNTIISQGYQNARNIQSKLKGINGEIVSKKLNELEKIAKSKLKELEPIEMNITMGNMSGILAAKVGNECLLPISEIVSMVLLTKFKPKK